MPIIRLANTFYKPLHFNKLAAQKAFARWGLLILGLDLRGILTSTVVIYRILAHIMDDIRSPLDTRSPRFMDQLRIHIRQNVDISTKYH